MRPLISFLLYPMGTICKLSLSVSTRKNDNLVKSTAFKRSQHGWLSRGMLYLRIDTEGRSIESIGRWSSQYCVDVPEHVGARLAGRGRGRVAGRRRGRGAGRGPGRGAGRGPGRALLAAPPPAAAALRAARPGAAR